ncbi:MAG: protein kinase domain-containing protein [Eubacteriaceae bacterium]|jgi:serine/threonine protein kinase
MKKMLTGRVIGTRYEIGSFIARGGTADIYLCRDITSQLTKNFAVKCISKEKSPEVLEQYRQEVTMLDKLSHTNIPMIHFTCEDSEYIYVIENYISGYSLNNRIAEKGLLTENEAVSLGMTLCKILSYLHGQKIPIIYCDLSPKNIMIDENNAPHLLDFGLAQALKKGERSKQPPLGTAGFAAPEQWKNGSRIIDNRTDIYDLGATLYSLLTGESIYNRFPEQPNRLSDKLSPGMTSIISKATAYKPEERYQTVHELYSDLQALKRFDEDYLKKQKKKFIICVVFAVITVCLALMTIASYFSWSNETQGKYTEAVTEAQKYKQNGNIDQAKESYLKAISINPAVLDAYEQMFDMLLPAENNPDYLAQSKIAVDSIRLSSNPNQFKSDLKFLNSLLDETINLQDNVYGEYARKIIQVLKETSDYKENGIARKKIDAYEVIAENSVSGQSDTDKIQSAVNDLIEIAEDDSTDPEGRLNIYYTVIQLYTLDPDQIDLDLNRTASGIEQIETQNSSSETFSFRKTVPLHTAIASLYYQNYLETGGQDQIDSACAWITSLDNMVLNTESMVLKGKILAAKGSYTLAKQCFQNVLDVDANNTSALLGMTSACIDEQDAAGTADFTEALEYYNRLSQGDSLSSGTLNQMNALKVKMGL